MFRFNKVSKFKNAAPRIPKREQCFTDLPIGTLMSSCGNYVKANCKFIALNVQLGSGGGITVLNLEDYGRKGRTIPIILGHGDFVSDLDFSPFDECLLATGSYDGYVKLWKIPDEGLTETLTNADLALPPSEKRIENILFHPSASNVLAVTVLDQLKIFDCSDGSLKYKFDNDNDKQFQSMSWKADGSVLITSCKDTNLRVIDPRQSTVAMKTSGHCGIKDSRALWVGNKDTILSTGFGEARERVVGLWDTRNFENPLGTTEADSSSGTLMPFFDPDTNMLLCAGKGDSNIRFYEVIDTDPFIKLASSESVELPTLGMAMVPKRAMHLMEAEVNRLLQLTKNTIVPLSYIVPRRSYVDFYPELFPDTASGQPAMTAEEWISGVTKEVDKVKLQPGQNGSSKEKKPTAGLKGLKSKATESQESPKVSDDPKPEDSPAAKASDSAPKPAAVTKNEIKESPKVKASDSVPKPKAVTKNETKEKSAKVSESSSKPKKAFKFGGMRSSKFKHLVGKPLHKRTNIDNIRGLDQSLAGESDGLQAYKDLVAIPIAGPGGQIAVLNLSKPGKLGSTNPPVLQNPSSLLDFVMDPFNNNNIAAACDDGVVRLWRVPDEGLTETLETPVASLKGHNHKVNVVRYHPTAEGLLASGSYDLTVKLWDVNTSTDFITLEKHPEQLLAFAWHPDGQLLATVCKDNKIRLFDPRAGKQEIKVGDALEGNRGARILWGGPNNDWLILSGFDRGGQRCLQLHDSKDLNVLSAVELDTSPSILMIHYDEDSSTLFATGKGDSTIYCYEVVKESPELFEMSHHKASIVHQGVAYLQKDLCDVRSVEFIKAVRLTKSSIEQLSFTVPRVKKELFQNDLFPETRVTWEPSLSCEQWKQGENKEQKRLDLQPEGMTALHNAPKGAPAAKKYESKRELEDARSEEQKKEQLVNEMMNKLTDLDDKPLEQDLMEGVEEDEWDE